MFNYMTDLSTVEIDEAETRSIAIQSKQLSKHSHLSHHSNNSNNSAMMSKFCSCTAVLCLQHTICRVCFSSTWMKCYSSSARTRFV